MEATPEAPPDPDADPEAAKLRRFADVLSGVGLGVSGPLRRFKPASRDRRERANVPYSHQYAAVKRMMRPETTRLILGHDPGLGKTFTSLSLVAADAVENAGRFSRVLISAPTSILKQWKNEVSDTLVLQDRFVLATNRLGEVTEASLKRARVVIVSRELVGRAFSSCFTWRQRHHQNQRGSWVSSWERTEGKPLHPLLAASFDIFFIDECHFMRSTTTAWTRGHEQVAKKARKVIGLTATPLVNRPTDLVGISVACNLPAEYSDVKNWFLDASRTRVNVDTVRSFRTNYIDRATDALLDLPPLTDVYKDFDARMDHEATIEYNDLLSVARRLRSHIERRGSAGAADVQRLIQTLQRLQQLIIAPLVSQVGACEFQKDKELIQRAADAGSGALTALHETVRELNSNGSARVLVCACHTSLLRVAEAFLQKRGGVGEILLFEGSLSTSKRSKVVEAFLGGDHTVLLMSIDAGGTGLHLVPGSNAVVFWGSRPFSPMQTLQSKKRVHRIGQTEPVKVVHLIATGSVDWALQRVHADKLSLSAAVLDGELNELEALGGRWKTTGRIVDCCRFLDKSGNFSDVVTDAEAFCQAGATPAATPAAAPPFVPRAPLIVPQAPQLAPGPLAWPVAPAPPADVFPRLSHAFLQHPLHLAVHAQASAPRAPPTENTANEGSLYILSGVASDRAPVREAPAHANLRVIWRQVVKL